LCYHYTIGQRGNKLRRASISAKRNFGTDVI